MKYTVQGTRRIGTANFARETRLAGSLLSTLAVVTLALIPRAWGLADFLTTDEAYHWIGRVEDFAAAVGAGRWADTFLIGHPGVTLMWLGGLGLRLESLGVVVWAGAPDRLAHLALLRLGPVLVRALAVGAGYLLLRRLVRPGLALMAAILWATSPFAVAHGRLLHLDALLADFVTLAMLATLAACFAERRWPWLTLAGVLCGLALLTKGPGLIVLPVLGLALFALGRPEHEDFRPRLLWSASRYLLILGVALLTAFALWPALWVTPYAALKGYASEITANGGSPTGWGQFFLGRAVGDPGPLFYPLVSLYRLTPVELLGLALLPAAAWGWARARDLDPDVRRERAALLALAALAAFWLLVMTLGAKKFDRYILPAWPALMTLSAAGLLEGWAWLRARLRAPAGPGAPLALALAAQVGILAWYHPYYLSYYNPLLGGGPAAQRMFLIGWGEGMDQVGAWLSAQPDIRAGQVASDLHPTLQPFVPTPMRRVQATDKVAANYAVVYLEALQSGALPERYASIQSTLPLHTVTIHGIEYARIYQLPRPFTTPSAAAFGQALRLRGYSAAQEGATLTVTPAWDVRATPAADLTLFLYVLDAAGAKVAQIDVRPGGASYPSTDHWQPGRQIAVPLPIPLPAGLPAGTYTLALGLYDPATGARLPLTAGEAASPAAAGPDAALLGHITLVEP